MPPVHALPLGRTSEDLVDEEGNPTQGAVRSRHAACDLRIPRSLFDVTAGKRIRIDDATAGLDGQSTHGMLACCTQAGKHSCSLTEHGARCQGTLDELEAVLAPEVAAANAALEAEARANGLAPGQQPQQGVTLLGGLVDRKSKVGDRTR